MTESSTNRRRVVITGMGIVSAGGCDLAGFWSNLVSGRPSIRRIARFDVSAYPSQIAAEIDNFQIRDLVDAPAEWINRGRIAQYAAAAAEMAIEDASLLRSLKPSASVGVALAAGMGSYGHEEVFAPCAAARSSTADFDWKAFTDMLHRTAGARSPERRTPGSIPASIAHHHAFRGPVMSVMTACAGGTQAIGDATRWIRTGRADVVVAGGADSELYPMGLASFCLLGALSKRNATPAAASRPFDADRDGFVLGEGGGVVVLEERGRALDRGARIYGEIAGFGSACDSYRVTDPHPEGLGAMLAMTRALADARVSSSEIDYINAHGTSTLANDRIETLAISSVFGERASRVPISSTKSMLGHATVAAGAVEAIVTALSLTHQTIHPTINQEVPDPACPLDYVPNRARAADMELALSNSFAFGGQSATLVFRRHHAE
jgi:3-oxoacyl-[acyl-carrier-protein] synthase II